MGVDFFPCDFCGESICDCGSYITCNDKCYRRWCDKECAKNDGYIRDLEDDDENNVSCGYCRNELFTDWKILDYVLEKFNLDKEEIVKEMRDGAK